VLQPEDLSAQQFVFPCTQTSFGNLRTEVIVVVDVVEVVAEDVVVVVAAHCHISFDDETSVLENQCHGQSQCFLQLAPWLVEVQKAEIEHSETQKDKLPLMK
jgi:hypothetical protein